MGYIKFNTTGVAGIQDVINADGISGVQADAESILFTYGNCITDDGAGTATFTTGVKITYDDGTFAASSIVDKWRDAIVAASGLQGGVAIVVDESIAADADTVVSTVIVGKVEIPDITV